MTRAEQRAAFVVRASYDDLSATAHQQLKMRVLDTLGCAMGALIGDPFASPIGRSTSSARPGTAR